MAGKDKGENATRPDKAAVEVIEAAPLKRGKGVDATADLKQFDDPVVIERAELKKLHEAFVAADRSQGAGGPNAAPAGPPAAEGAFVPSPDAGV